MRVKVPTMDQVLDKGQDFNHGSWFL